MNICDFTALIAANPPSTTDHLRSEYQDQMDSASSHPLSPRAKFKSRVQSLQRPSSRASISSRSSRTGPPSRPHTELQHVSSLRVTHKKIQSAQSMTHETPDFCTAEREAWGSRSPGTPKSNRLSVDTLNTVSPSSDKKPNLQSRFSVPMGNKQIKPPQRVLRHSTKRASLRSFAPLKTIADVDERSKTSHEEDDVGSIELPDDSSQVVGKEEEEDEAIPNGDPTKPMSTRPSRFVEGSMNNRSKSIASSWFHDLPSESDNKPLPPTPKAKHVTFNPIPTEEPAVPAGRTPKKSRKGLRKSMSHFNLQTLSDKMKLFTSSHDTTEEHDDRKKDTKPDAAGLGLLNERKRKAEEAYALHFGTKKQKFTAQSHNPAPSSSSNVSAASNNNPRRSETASTTRNLRSTRSTNAISLRTPALNRKKSRRELERENAELRARLSHQQDHAHDQDQNQGPEQEQEQTQSRTSMDSTTRKSKRADPSAAPPVPRVPLRSALKVMENMEQAARRAGGGFKSENWAVMEEEDDEAGSNVGEARGKSRVPSLRGERTSFEWDEDVF